MTCERKHEALIVTVGDALRGLRMVAPDCALFDRALLESVAPMQKFVGATFRAGENSYLIDGYHDPHRGILHGTLQPQTFPADHLERRSIERTESMLARMAEHGGPSGEARAARLREKLLP